ncbi:MAG: type II secretion system protein [Candidatus Paceibacterota bacterium]|jgi:prepilin-type N-terminal cleavage/methylation domain-containing protein
MFLFFKKFLRIKDRNLLAHASFKSCRGFTLLELLVVISIFLIITAVVMVDIPNFRNKSSLELVTNEVATYVRGAQVYGTSQKANVSLYPKYGVSFDSNDPKHFYLFAGDPAQVNGREDYNIDGFKVDLFEKGNPSNVYTGVTTIIYEGRLNSLIGSNLIPVFDNENDPNIRNIDCLMVRITSVKDGQSSCVLVYKNGQIMTGNDCTS